MSRIDAHVDAQVQAHVRAIEACNQRGGRMLSLVDLIDAQTVDLPLAAYLAATMQGGSSLLVGARPGAAGKTAVMCALLNFLPSRTRIRPVDRPAVLEAALRDDRTRQTCYLAHEIGAGNWYAYVWGRDARAFFRLAAQGHIIASNLHADTLEETYDQLCRENGVAHAHLDAVTLKVYLRMARAGGRSIRRWVSHVYESDGTGDRLLWTGDVDGTFTRQGRSAIASPSQEDQYAVLLADLLGRGLRHIETVRRTLVAGQEETHSSHMNRDRRTRTR